MESTSNYQRLNNIVGWLVFVIASFVYLSTMEATASFWDCGEYISSCYKLEVGHPPGAPLFSLIGRCFSFLALGDVTEVGRMINAMSALSSSFTILFLFWTITALARKVMIKDGEITPGATYAVMGAGAVGAFAYTFSDSFWFSASEGEVYAMSSFFMAIVFWAILKWEREMDTGNNADRWLVLLSYLIGLSIGVHLLNLLAIPAIVFIYYFKKYDTTPKGLAITALVAVFLLGGVQAGLIPLIVSLAAKFELLFVNTFGLPFNSGMLAYGILLVGGIVFGLRYSERKMMYGLNIGILCFTVLLIGYSSFAVLVIRSNANPPMDENNPENAVNLLSYLNREQYGTWPKGYGPYFSAPVDIKNPYSDGNPVYTEDEETGKYVISDDRKGTVPNYNKKLCTVFPRMWSGQERHIRGYKMWTEERDYQRVEAIDPQTGKMKTYEKPTFLQNLEFFFEYQIGHMYMRYFMWNYTGRQNDIQGHGNNGIHGNWISGIDFIDEARLGPQTDLPSNLDANKARNVFYGLPFILGLIGMFYHIKKDNKNATVVGLLFFFTGLAIIIYVNPKPFEPRERDYAFTASFYAYAIWIGFGVLAIFELLRSKMTESLSAIVTTVLCLLAVPTIMAKEGWDDHDRSGRTIARDFAVNYLESCAPNAILFTNGDNDTFPLWYAQEVEGIRTDVRVICLELLNTDWYIDQMVRKAYDSDPVPITFTKKQYRQGTRDVVLFRDYKGRKIEGYIPVSQLIDFVKGEGDDKKIKINKHTSYSFFPTKNMRVPVDSATVVSNGTVSPEQASKIVDNIDWTMPGGYVQKNDLMILDMLAHNNWERPIYFAATAPATSYLGLGEYLQLEGLAFRLVPVKQKARGGMQDSQIATDIMYNNVMNKFTWGGMEKPGANLDDVFVRSCALNVRQRLVALAEALVSKGENEKAIAVLDKIIEVTPEENVSYDVVMYYVTMSYYKLGEFEKANAVGGALFDTYCNDLAYYSKLKRGERQQFVRKMDQAQDVNERLIAISKQQYNQAEFSDSLSIKYTALLQECGLSPKLQQQ